MDACGSLTAVEFQSPIGALQYTTTMGFDLTGDSYWPVHSLQYSDGRLSDFHKRLLSVKCVSHVYV